MLHACGYPQGTGSSHTTALGADSTSQLMFHILFWFNFKIIAQNYTKSPKQPTFLRKNRGNAGFIDKIGARNFTVSNPSQTSNNQKRLSNE
jgi:hypothetical protein